MIEGYYTAKSGPFAGMVVGPGQVAIRDAVCIPVEDRRTADCKNLLDRARMVLELIACGRMDCHDAIDMAQYIADAIGHDTTDQDPIQEMRHRCIDCGDYFEHRCS